MIILISRIGEHEQQNHQWDLAFMFRCRRQARREPPTALRDRRAHLSAPSLTEDVLLLLLVRSQRGCGALSGREGCQGFTIIMSKYPLGHSRPPPPPPDSTSRISSAFLHTTCGDTGVRAAGRFGELLGFQLLTIGATATVLTAVRQLKASRISNFHFWSLSGNECIYLCSLRE